MNAAEKYVETLGKLEPSYVLHKLMDAQRLPPLTFYLEALVSYNSKHGIVTGATEHRSLLITCYAKEKDENNLKRLLEDYKVTFYSSFNIQFHGKLPSVAI